MEKQEISRLKLPHSRPSNYITVTVTTYEELKM